MIILWLTKKGTSTTADEDRWFLYINIPWPGYTALLGSLRKVGGSWTGWGTVDWEGVAWIGIDWGGIGWIEMDWDGMGWTAGTSGRTGAGVRSGSTMWTLWVWLCWGWIVVWGGGFVVFVGGVTGLGVVVVVVTIVAGNSVAANTVNGSFFLVFPSLFELTPFIWTHTNLPGVALISANL